MSEFLFYFAKSLNFVIFEEHIFYRTPPVDVSVCTVILGLYLQVMHFLPIIPFISTLSGVGYNFLKRH